MVLYHYVYKYATVCITSNEPSLYDLQLFTLLKNLISGKCTGFVFGRYINL